MITLQTPSVSHDNNNFKRYTSYCKIFSTFYYVFTSSFYLAAYHNEFPVYSTIYFLHRFGLSCDKFLTLFTSSVINMHNSIFIALNILFYIIIATAIYQKLGSELSVSRKSITRIMSSSIINIKSYYFQTC